MEDDIELIKSILPNIGEAEIIRELNETNDIGAAVKNLMRNNKSPGKNRNKRIIVLVSNDCDQVVIDGIHDATNSIPSLVVERSEIAPQFTISVSFHEKPCKPMIYVDPKPFDSQFCSNIEEHSIILVKESYDDIDAQVDCSLNSLILLPLTRENVSTSLKNVFIENGIIGEGYGSFKLYGNLWNEMLRKIPMISATYADAISTSVPNPYSMSIYDENETNNPIISKSGNKIPKRIIDTLKLFYNSDDPSEKLETGPRKRISI
ncbi:hypothetical protein M9Y10_027985 [Tritrichomonas musculus]|uniref:CUE domain-containing protein n=1 Tax=Tritrichomonas musculus TaxID=1915356 RepID=A0ABR2KI51_9EUKA